MLTSFEIENFKGVADRQRIQFAPLTLLFGANSAGKSSILQALFYLHELIQGRSANVGRTELGGEVVELGGFARLVHKYETDRAIVLRAEFLTPEPLELFGRDLMSFPLRDLDEEMTSAWLELTVRSLDTPTGRGPVVERVVIGVNGLPEPLVGLKVGDSLREGEPLLAAVNFNHPILKRDPSPQRREKYEWGGHELLDPYQLNYWRSIACADEVPYRHHGVAGSERLSVFKLARRRHVSALPLLSEPLRVIPCRDNADDDSVNLEIEDVATEQVQTFLEMVVLGATSQLASFLREAIYIGPLRSIPPPGFLYERPGRGSSWADGLAAWDLLLADRRSLVADTNNWLDQLGAGCQVVVRELSDRFAEARESLNDLGDGDDTVRQLRLKTSAGSYVFPSEVGAGISQLIPVIVAAIAGRHGITLVEQPEIHVHPAVQVALGDMFIEAATRPGSRRLLLVETHSEHLILRLLRRIRETTETKLPEAPTAFSESMLSVIHVESMGSGVRVRRLRVDEHGEFVDRWPNGFFAERMEELL